MKVSMNGSATVGLFVISALLVCLPGLAEEPEFEIKFAEKVTEEVEEMIVEEAGDLHLTVVTEAEIPAAEVELNFEADTMSGGCQTSRVCPGGGFVGPYVLSCQGRHSCYNEPSCLAVVCDGFGLECFPNSGC